MYLHTTYVPAINEGPMRPADVCDHRNHVRLRPDEGSILAPITRGRQSGYNHDPVYIVDVLSFPRATGGFSINTILYMVSWRNRHLVCYWLGQGIITTTLTITIKYITTAVLVASSTLVIALISH